MGAALAGPPLGDAERLLWLVRKLPAGEFASVFRRGLAAAQLLQVIAALPAERRDQLVARARHRQPPPQLSRRAALERRRGRPIATAVRSARQQAGSSQAALARLVGVQQATVSQWERGVTEPSGLHLAALLGVLPGLADLLGTPAAPTARGQPPSSRAS